MDIKSGELNWLAAGRFQERLKHKRNVCKTAKYQKTLKSNLFYLLDIPRRYIMCAPFKSGSSSWHHTFWAMRRKRANLSMDSTYFTHLDWQGNQGRSFHISVEDGIKLITSVPGDDDFNREPPPRSSFRLILTRHPFARFISGWNQKFHVTIDYWKTLYRGFHGLKSYKKLPTGENHVMAFEDFANYAANNSKVIRSVDGHFMPISSICKPCELDYTYILKAESIGKDELWLKKRLGMEDIAIFRVGVGPGRSTTKNNPVTNIKYYMSKLQPNIVKRLYEVYKEDFDTFGYSFNFTTLEAGGFE
ncbi:carbohydrate sulfotransferase 10-like isoform X2 [Styela clava]